jgi:hypothetical protein
MRRAAAYFFAAALAAAALSSCSRGADLVVGSAPPQLRQELSRLAAEYSRSSGVHITVADKPSSPGSAAVTIGWSFVPSKVDGKPFPLSKEKVRAAGFRTALAFEQWAQSDTGWREVPILWDAWGFASSPGTLAVRSHSATFEWKDRGALIKAKLLFLSPGSESGVRQSLFWFAGAELPESGALTATVLGGAERSGPASLVYFKSFAAIGRDRVFSPGSFNLMKPDVENLARNTGVDLLFGNYEWLRGIQRAGGRDFRALVYPLPHGYAMPVSLLSARVTGSGDSAARARDFLFWLLSPENQKALSGGTGYMAANFNAANLDANSLGARETAIGAVRIVPIDPAPVKGSAAEAWDSLLGGILARPADWERVLAERGKR